MTVRDLTHERCANRVCCPSWSCEPHRADCEIVTGRHRPVPTFARGEVLAVPRVTDLRGQPLEDAA